jgi:dedicator of cytokinesis protein 3
MERVRSPATMPSIVPVSFPSSYPFSLISEGSVPSKTFVHGVLHQTSNFYNCGLAEAAVVFIVMILASPRKDIITFLELTLEIEGRASLSRLLTSLFSVSTSILNNDAFPSRWLNINVLAHKVLLKLGDAVAFIIKKEFIPKDLDNPDFEFDQGLWYDYLHMLLKLLSSDQLVIEEFSPQVSPVVLLLGSILLPFLETASCVAFGWRYSWRGSHCPITVLGCAWLAGDIW